MSIWDDLEKIDLQESQNLEEMSRVGFVDTYEIYVNTDDPGNIPHFHIRDSATRGNNFHTCIKICSNEYFHHTGKEDVLRKKDLKKLCKFLSDNSGDDEFKTNWNVLIFMWNRNNSKMKVDKTQPMPDYTNIK